MLLDACSVPAEEPLLSFARMFSKPKSDSCAPGGPSEVRAHIE